MSIQRDTANQHQFGVAGPGANPENTCSLNNMQLKARIPQKHGRDVLDEHLAFSTVIIPTGQQHVCAPVIDQGASLMAVQTVGQPGTNHSIIHGTIPSVGNPNFGIPGNSPLDFIFQTRSRPSGTKIPPKSKRVGEVFELVEKGIEHSLSLANHLPSHLATSQIAGLKNKALKSVATAKQQFEKILTGDMLAQIPGLKFSMGDMLSQMTAGQKSEMFSGMPAEVKGAIENAMVLIQSDISADSGGFSTDDKINPDVFLQNAVDALKGSKTVEDVFQTLQSLEDDTLRGLDQYANVAIEIETAFGNVVQQVNSSGGVSIDIPDAVQSALSAFQSQMGQLPGAGGASAGMFDQSAIKNIFNRLTTTNQNKFKTLIKDHVDSGKAPRDRINRSDGLFGGGKLFPGF